MGSKNWPHLGPFIIKKVKRMTNLHQEVQEHENKEFDNKKKESKE